MEGEWVIWTLVIWSGVGPSLAWHLGRMRGADEQKRKQRRREFYKQHNS